MKPWKKTFLVILISVLTGIFGIGLIVSTLLNIIQESMGSGTLVIEDLNTGETFQIALSNNRGFPVLSPDGKSVVCATVSNTDDHLIHYNLLSGAEDTLLRSTASLYAAGWDESGKSIYYFTENSKQVMLCRYDGTVVDTLSVFPEYRSEFRISPNGKYVVMMDTVRNRNGIFLHDVESGSRYELSKNVNLMTTPSAICWLDSTRIAFVSDLNLYVMNVKTARIERNLEVSELSNFVEIFGNPSERNHLYLKARQSDGGVGFKLYKLDILKGTCEIWRDDKSDFTLAYQFNKDGTKLIYRSSSKM